MSVSSVQIFINIFVTLQIHKSLFFVLFSESSGFPQKLKMKESSSSKKDKRRISVLGTPRRLTTEPQAREWIPEAQFDPNPDSSGLKALQLYAEHYFGRIEPSLSSGEKALALYESYKQNSNLPDNSLQLDLPGHGRQKSKIKSPPHLSVVEPEASNSFPEPHLSQDSQLPPSPNQNNQPHTYPKNSAADKNISMYQEMLRAFPEHPYYGGPPRSSGSGRQN